MRGMWVLKRTGDLQQALEETQKAFAEDGFTVRQNDYDESSGASGSQ
jgi:hypothetical protein